MLGMIELLHGLDMGTKEGFREKLFLEARPQEYRNFRDDALNIELVEEVRAYKDQLDKQPITALTYSTFKLFSEQGSRVEYESLYFARRLRLNTYALLVLIDERLEDVASLEDIIWAICDEYTWCVPAHLANRTGDQLRYTIDLFAAETGWALSEIVELTKNKLAPEIIERVEREVTSRILEPFMELRPMHWWETATNNWASVCASSIGACAIYWIEDNQILAPVLSRVVQVLRNYLSGFGEDGACTEGLSYWKYGFGFYVAFAELLRERTSGVVDLLQSEKVKSIALFQQHSYLYENFTISFSDGSLTSSFHAGLTSKLSERIGQVQIPNIKYRSSFGEDHCHRWIHAARNIFWVKPEGSKSAESTQAPSSCYWKDAEWFVTRSQVQGHTVVFVAKSGHNDEHHNHNDVGNFILHLDGETFLVDPGAGEYTKDYFSPRRYEFTVAGSQGHSVPIICGQYQQAGREYRGEVIQAEFGERTDRFVIELSDAYQVDSLIECRRTYHYERASGVMNCTDEYKIAEPCSDIRSRFVSFLQPLEIAAGKLLLKGERHSVLVQYNALSCTHAWSVTEYIDHHHDVRTLYMLDVMPRDMKNEAIEGTEFKVEVSFTPLWEHKGSRYE
ncbi:heparinase II/III family protein [Paenibacillus sp. sgz5001063]|uniref:heparinase II/III domain-containing protein n=1 Tax=Paenibacillus sp. sgz5001063 TaxID=3242474 RepID=UPI0036D22993